MFFLFKLKQNPIYFHQKKIPKPTKQRKPSGQTLQKTHTQFTNRCGRTLKPTGRAADFFPNTCSPKSHAHSCRKPHEGSIYGRKLANEEKQSQPFFQPLNIYQYPLLGGGGASTCPGLCSLVRGSSYAASAGHQPSLQQSEGPHSTAA